MKVAYTCFPFSKLISSADLLVTRATSGKLQSISTRVIGPIETTRVTFPVNEFLALLESLDKARVISSDLIQVQTSSPAG